MFQKRTTKFLIIFFVVQLICACSGSKEVKKAKDFLDAGMFDQAAILLKQEIQADPKNAEAHMLLGTAYLGQGMGGLAEQEFNVVALMESGLKLEVSKRCYVVAKQLIKNDKSKARFALLKAKEYDPTIEKDEQFFFLTNIDTEENTSIRLESAKKYLILFPSGTNTAQATFEIAEGLFYLGNREQAKSYYGQVSSQFSATDWGQKATDRLANWIEIKTISLPAKEKWFDTGISLSKGQSFTIKASGQWSNGGDKPLFIDPDGFSSSYPGAILGSANLAKLIGKIDDSVFAIGKNYSGNSLSSGKLFVGMNDTPDGFSDNSGTLSVEISYSSK